MNQIGDVGIEEIINLHTQNWFCRWWYCVIYLLWGTFETDIWFSKCTWEMMIGFKWFVRGNPIARHGDNWMDIISVRLELKQSQKPTPPYHHPIHFNPLRCLHIYICIFQDERYITHSELTDFFFTQHRWTKVISIYLDFTSKFSNHSFLQFLKFSSSRLPQTLQYKVGQTTNGPHIYYIRPTYIRDKQTHSIPADEWENRESTSAATQRVVCSDQSENANLTKEPSLVTKVNDWSAPSRRTTARCGASFGSSDADVVFGKAFSKTSKPVDYR